MTAILYLITGIITFSLIMIMKGHRSKKVILILHSAANLAIAGYIMFACAIPETSGFFRVDHLSAFEAGLSSVVFFAASLYAGGYVTRLIETGELNPKSLRLFYGGFSILMTVTPLVFLSDNLALFWILAEITTVVSAMLVASLAAKENIDAALKYIFIASTAMLFAFIGLIFLFEMSRTGGGAGTLNWSELMTMSQGFDPAVSLAAFFFVFIGFSAKSGIVPFHTWLPDAHSKAPSAVSAVLSGVLLNIGIYGIIRVYAIIRQVPETETAGLLVLFFGILTVFVASMMMLRQHNLKKLIACSSIENMGLILIGLSFWTPFAVFWVLFQTLAHSLTKAELFLSAGIIHRQYKSENPAEEDVICDAFDMQPAASAFLVAGALAITGTPLFPVFLPKLFILLKAIRFDTLTGILILLFIAIASFALFRFIWNAFSCRSDGVGIRKPEHYPVAKGMHIGIVFLLVLMLYFGIMVPDWFYNYLNMIITELGLGGAL
ncbi:proton-conducting transporter membrane subunit [Methanolacinia petrolearia]|uniref:proton-conducting transporter transmembrane domain-containing protein n=1 Tax=Methanolacinia petrolearia TaxID=54120 RepID=UPI003BAA2825